MLPPRMLWILLWPGILNERVRSVNTGIISAVIWIETLNFPVYSCMLFQERYTSKDNFNDRSGVEQSWRLEFA